MLRGQSLYGIVGQSRLYTANERTREMGTAVVGCVHAWLGSFERRFLVATGGAAGWPWGVVLVRRVLLFAFSIAAARRCAGYSGAVIFGVS